MSPAYSNLKETSNIHTHQLCTALCISKYWPHTRWAFSTKELSPDNLKRASKWQNTLQRDFWGKKKEAWGSWRSCSDQRNLAEIYWKVVWTLAAFMLCLPSSELLPEADCLCCQWLRVHLSRAEIVHQWPSSPLFCAAFSASHFLSSQYLTPKSQTNCFILAFCLKGQKFSLLVGREREL